MTPVAAEAIALRHITATADAGVWTPNTRKVTATIPGKTGAIHAVGPWESWKGEENVWLVTIQRAIPPASLTPHESICGITRARYAIAMSRSTSPAPKIARGRFTRLRLAAAASPPDGARSSYSPNDSRRLPQPNRRATCFRTGVCDYNRVCLGSPHDQAVADSPGLRLHSRSWPVRHGGSRCE